MKKFITTLAAALVIGSAASATTFVEVFRIDGERYMIKVPATNVLQQVVDTHAIPTAGGTYSTLVADTHAIPTAGGTYDVGSSSTIANYNWEALPDSEHLTIDADPFAEEIVGGLGPQLPYDPMRGVDYGFVQALLQQNVDPFSEVIVGGLGPQSDLDSMMTLMTDWVQPATNVDPFSEEVVGGLGPQINFVASN